MRKIQSLVILILISLTSVNAQIGVFTESPLTLLHIDTNKDNDAGGGSQSDDVVVTQDGNMGIGTVAPTTKLDVRGSLRYVDGNQQQDLVLVSDAVGNAKWAPSPYPETIYPNEDVGGMLAAHNISPEAQYMGVSITLPAGSWQICFNGTYYNSSPNTLTIWWDLSVSDGADLVAGRVLSSSGIQGSYCPVSAIYFVTHAVTTTYYMWAFSNLPAATAVSYTGEGRMWAVPMSN